MKWTKHRSKLAVAAKARKRMAWVPPEESNIKVRLPRKMAARFTLQLRDHKNGDSITMKLYPAPWPNCWMSEHGQFSSSRIGRAISLMLSGGI